MLSILLLLSSTLFIMSRSFYWYNLLWSLIIAVVLSNLALYMESFSYEILSRQLATDSLSVLLIVLTLWILVCMLLASQAVWVSRNKASRFCVIVVILGMVLCAAFSAGDIFAFYMFFESSLIPTLMLIMGWGYQPERVQSVSYMVVYTVLGSLPLLLGAVWVYSDYSTGKMLMSHSLRLGLQTFCSSAGVMTLVFSMAFLIKLPVWPVHLWLPKAHVEAPVAGSMVLAAILLKLGGYGLIRMYQYLSLGSSSTSLAMYSVGLFGGMLAMLVCFQQVDLKALIAYSSVGHMSFVLAGVMSGTVWGWQGALVLMLSHGFSSSALFAFSGWVYSGYHSRSLLLVKGILLLSPVCATWLFMLCVVNMSAPPSINLLGEVMVLTSGLESSLLFAVPLGLIMFLACLCSLYLYTTLAHGGSLKMANVQSSYKSVECLTMVLHVYPVMTLILMGCLITQWF